MRLLADSPACAVTRRCTPEAVDVIAYYGVLQIGVPIYFDRAGDVTDLIQQNVFVRFHDAEILIVEMLGNPFRFDQHFGMRIL